MQRRTHAGRAGHARNRARPHGSREGTQPGGSCLGIGRSRTMGSWRRATSQSCGAPGPPLRTLVDHPPTAPCTACTASSRLCTHGKLEGYHSVHDIALRNDARDCSRDQHTPPEISKYPRPSSNDCQRPHARHLQPSTQNPAAAVLSRQHQGQNATFIPASLISQPCSMNRSTAFTNWPRSSRKVPHPTTFHHDQSRRRRIIHTG